MSMEEKRDCNSKFPLLVLHCDFFLMPLLVTCGFEQDLVLVGGEGSFSYQKGGKMFHPKVWRNKTWQKLEIPEDFLMFRWFLPPLNFKRGKVAQRGWVGQWLQRYSFGCWLVVVPSAFCLCCFFNSFCLKFCFDVLQLQEKSYQKKVVMIYFQMHLLFHNMHFLLLFLSKNQKPWKKSSLSSWFCLESPPCPRDESFAEKLGLRRGRWSSCNIELSLLSTSDGHWECSMSTWAVGLKGLALGSY